jgi:L-2-hydroxyglutarate oxidase LhgO
MMDKETVDCVVIGAGVIGLAVARALALASREVIVLEQANTIGTETSSRNSEVIHAGIYYAQASAKAHLCVAGKEFLYRYCRERGIPHQACGKLIVATEDRQIPVLRELARKAERNGVMDLQWLEPSEVAHLEPAVRCVGALRSPSSGILDSHSFMLSIQGDAENAGALFVFHSPVTGGEAGYDGVTLDVGGEEPMRLLASSVVNCAGLHAQELVQRLNGFPSALVPPCYYAKGNYYTVRGRGLFNGLIYPVPEEAGLGVHVTIDLAGQARFGPDVEWVDKIDYSVDPRRAEVFYQAIRRYWPGLEDGSLQPDYAGIRPKLQAPGQPTRDFLIQGPRQHGINGLVNLFGIESPGLTASLAIADHVVDLLAKGGS